MEFIVSVVQDNKRAIDTYDENETEMTNPFKDVADSVAFAKKLREDSCMIYGMQLMSLTF